MARTTLQTVKLHLLKFASQIIAGNYLLHVIEAIETDYKNEDAKLFAELIAYVNTNIFATTQQQDSAPTHSGSWGALTVNLSTGVCVVSKGTFVAGTLSVFKGGSKMTLGTDYSESNPSAGEFTFVAGWLPLFPNDVIVADYQYLPTPVNT